MRRVMAMLTALMLVICMAGCGSKDDNTFVVGMECNYAPFNWTQTEDSDTAVEIADGSGYADGYDVRIAQMIADGLGKELVIEKIEWDGLAMAVQSDKIDAIIAGMSPTEERKATIDFTDAYYESELVIVVRADSPYANAASLADFAGARITGQLNTFHYTVIDQIPGADIQMAMADFPTMIVSLQSGNIDGYVSELPGAISAASANSDLTYVQFAQGQGFACDPADSSVAVGLKKGSDLTDDINEILAGLSREQRQQLMDAATADQPLAE